VKFMNSWKNVVRATLVCLMLSSLVLLGSRISVADTTYFSIEATRTFNEHYGYYGGYHDVWTVIGPELAKIGIELTTQEFDDYEWWDQVWEEGWNRTGDNPYPLGGWDVTMLEWWLMPHALEPWFAAMCLNNMTPIEEGFNIHPWMNPRATNLLMKAMRTFDADARQKTLFGWQQEWMHDPPIAQIYYPRVYDLTGSYVLGYDPVGGWFYDMSHLDIDETAFDLYVTNPTRIAQGKDMLLYAISEAVWGWNPMFMETYTEEGVAALVYDTLYTWSLDYTDSEWQTKAGIVEPTWDDYAILPDLAAGYPISLEGGKRMRVPLRDDVVWSDGAQFNATDVKFTFDLTFTPKAKCSGTGDFAYVIDSVELVPDPGGVIDPYTGEGPIDPFMIDFVLHAPHPDFTSVICNGWGGGSIVPWHYLKDIPAQSLKGDVSNTDWTQMPPGTGPMKVTDYTDLTNIILEKNNLWWGYGEGRGPYVSQLVLQWLPEAPTRLTALQTNAVDFGEYPTASVATFQSMMTWDNVRVYQYDYPASNGVWFNFNNPYLSNRYVRQAIAHAIPYDTILGVIESWGVETAVLGRTYVLPGQHYSYGGTKVHLFDETLDPYFYDIATAQQYMNMWLYSQPLYAPEGSPEVNQGPVGDADFSGRVNFDDFWVWRENVGKSPIEWPWIPGMDVDPDFNNDESVTLDDFDSWRLNYGDHYPFAGAR